MRSALKFILLLAIAFSLAWLPSLYQEFRELTGNADNWIGPDKGTDTLIHFFIAIAAFLYLILQTIPACIGWLLAFDNRKAAFGLLLLPGFIGLIVAGAMARTCFDVSGKRLADTDLSAKRMRTIASGGSADSRSLRCCATLLPDQSSAARSTSTIGLAGRAWNSHDRTIPPFPTSGSIPRMR